MKIEVPDSKRKRKAKGRQGNNVRSESEFDRLIEEAIVDAYGESEQILGFYTMLEDNLAVPFQTEILGVEVTVERVDLTNDDQIISICSRGKLRQCISILDLPIPNPPPAGAEWIEAFRRWARWG